MKLKSQISPQKMRRIRWIIQNATRVTWVEVVQLRILVSSDIALVMVMSLYPNFRTAIPGWAYLGTRDVIPKRQQECCNGWLLFMQAGTLKRASRMIRSGWHRHLLIWRPFILHMGITWGRVSILMGRLFCMPVFGRIEKLKLSSLCQTIKCTPQALGLLALVQAHTLAFGKETPLEMDAGTLILSMMSSR
jgi:hypothetical protein